MTPPDRAPLDPLTGLYAGLIGELALVTVDLALTVDGLIDFLLKSGVASRTELKHHLEVYREHNELAMRDQVVERLRDADPCEDECN
jgi:hypothetical protein